MKIAYVNKSLVVTVQIHILLLSVVSIREGIQTRHNYSFCII